MKNKNNNRDTIISTILICTSIYGVSLYSLIKSNETSKSKVSSFSTMAYSINNGSYKVYAPGEQIIDYISILDVEEFTAPDGYEIMYYTNYKYLNSNNEIVECKKYTLTNIKSVNVTGIYNNDTDTFDFNTIGEVVEDNTLKLTE